MENPAELKKLRAKEYAKKYREKRKQSVSEEELVQQRKRKRVENMTEVQSETQRKRKRVENMSEEQKRKKREINRQVKRKKYTDKKVAASDVGEMTEPCQYCGALFWAKEYCKKSCCHSGKVKLPELNTYPPELQTVFTEPKFRDTIRNYNSSFAFASFSTTIVKPKTHGVYNLKIQGQVHHVAPTTLYTVPDNTPYAGQIYIHDPKQSLQLRKNRGDSSTKDAFLNVISDVMDRVNPYVKHYKRLHNIVTNDEEYALYFTRHPGLDPRRYNKPVTAECAALIVTTNGEIPQFDLCVYPIEGNGHRTICKLSGHVDPMVFPLLFPHGELGWSTNLFQHDNDDKRTSVLQYYAYRLMYRPSENFNPILFGGRLHQQYVIHAYIMIESSRMDYFRLNQSGLRVECYQGLLDHISNSVLNDSTSTKRYRLGNVFILPSSFIGSPRHMQQIYQDAMSIVRKHGRPDLFITMTCNPNWPELKRELKKMSSCGVKLQVADTPLLVARVFHLKFKSLIAEILSGNLFGPILSYVYTVEFQKRGLPHVHMLFTLHHDCKLRTPEQIDEHIRAEIPDDDDELKVLVKRHMLHGPHSPSSPCLNSDGNCSKKFPKDYRENTVMNENGFPWYRRRQTTDQIEKYAAKVGGNFVAVDNRMVVPYNPYLLKKYQCHINVEYCMSVMSVKYIHKYIHKGHDRAAVRIKKLTEEPIDESEDVYDEIGTYLDTRYVSPVEAAWRLLELPLHDKSHTVSRLPIHCENMHNVVFEEGQEKKAILNKTETALTAWFRLNATDEYARNILYRNIPEYYCYKPKLKTWIRRSNAINIVGRLYSVSPKDVERFNLKLILNYKPGATCFRDLKTHDGIVYKTFRETVIAMKLVETEEYVYEMFEEACAIMMPSQLRQYFALFLCGEIPSNAREIWNRCKPFFLEGFKDNNEYRALSHISKILESENFSCTRFNLPEPDIDIKLIKMEETEEYAREQLAKGELLKHQLNDDQLFAFNTVMDSITNKTDNKIYFLDGPGGTGKTFVYKAMIHTLIGRGLNVLPVAWTGIASILLPGGMTSHRAFKLPIDIGFRDTCYVKPKDKQVLADCDVIIWDEASMILKKAVEMVDDLLRDVNRTPHEFFGGKYVIFGGDFRQILPVIKFAGRTTIVDSSLKRTTFWPYVNQLRLTINMRSVDPEFSDYLLKIGDGSEKCLTVPKGWQTNDICKAIYGSKLNPEADLSRKIILACHNQDVNMLNSKILKTITGEEFLYLSTDEAKHKGVDQTDEDVKLEYQIDYLNSLNFPGFPVHKLKLKVGAIVMLLRNLSIQDGLCNGTRLQIVQLYRNHVGARILTGDHAGEVVFIPRIKLDTEESTNLPFVLHRRQFPIQLAFAMTINKSQGQSFDRVGIYVNKPLFSHGQLYVALSRCTRRKGIEIQSVTNEIQNVVWDEIFID